MRNIHDSHDIYALDCLMPMTYIIYQAVGESNRIAEKISARRKEFTMHTNEHTTVWGTPIGIGRARATKSWYQQLRDWWTAHKAAREQANLEALHRCWDARREAVTSHRAEAAPEMAAAHHTRSVATMVYGLAV
jgi:hypothetical protein